MRECLSIQVCKDIYIFRYGSPIKVSRITNVRDKNKLRKVPLKSAGIGRLYFALANYRNASVFVTGGAAKDNTSKWIPQNSTAIYDIKKDIWTDGPPFNVARNAHSSCLIGSKVFIFGGEDIDGSIINTIESFDVEGQDQAWERINLEAVTPRIYSVVSPLNQ